MSQKIHIVLDDELAERVKSLAKAEERPLSRQVAYLLRKAMEEEMPFEPGKPPERLGELDAYATVPQVPEDATPPNPDEPWWEQK